MIKKILISLMVLTVGLIISIQHVEAFYKVDLSPNQAVFNETYQQLQQEATLIEHGIYTSVFISSDNRVIEVSKLGLTNYEPTTVRDLTSSFNLQKNEYFVMLEYLFLRPSSTELDGYLVVTNLNRVYSWGQINSPKLGRGNISSVLSLNPGLVNVPIDPNASIVGVVDSRSTTYLLTSFGQLYYSGAGGFNSNEFTFFNLSGVQGLASDELFVNMYADSNTLILRTNKEQFYLFGANRESLYILGESTYSTPVNITPTMTSQLNDNEIITKLIVKFDKFVFYTSDNRIFAKGKNPNGLFGNGNSNDLLTLTDITDFYVSENDAIVDILLQEESIFSEDKDYFLVLLEDGSLLFSGSNVRFLLNDDTQLVSSSPVDISSTFISQPDKILMIRSSQGSLLVKTQDNKHFVIGLVIKTSNFEAQKTPLNIDVKLIVTRDYDIPFQVKSVFAANGRSILITKNNELYTAGTGFDQTILGRGSVGTNSTFFSSNDFIKQSISDFQIKKVDSTGINSGMLLEDGTLFTWGRNWAAFSYLVNPGATSSQQDINIFNLTSAFNLNVGERIIDFSTTNDKGLYNSGVITNLGRMFHWGVQTEINGTTNSQAIIETSALTKVTNQLATGETPVALLDVFLVLTNLGNIIDISETRRHSLGSDFSLPNQELPVKYEHPFILSDANTLYHVNNGFTDVTQSVLSSIQAAPYLDNSNGIKSFSFHFTRQTGIPNAGLFIISNNGHLYELNEDYSVKKAYAVDLSHPSDQLDFISVIAGDTSPSSIHGLVKTSLGFVYSFGSNSNGRLGLGDTINRTELTIVNPLTSEALYKVKALQVPKSTYYTDESIPITILFNQDLTGFISDIKINNTFYPVSAFTKLDAFTYSLDLPNTFLLSDNPTFTVGQVKLLDGTTKDLSLNITAHTNLISENRRLTLQLNGGRYGNLPILSLIYQEGTSLDALLTPTRQHYNFTGWYIDEELTTLFTETIMPTKDTILYAMWEEKTYNLIFKYENGVNNAAEITRISLKHGTDISTITIPVDPVATGYTFKQWLNIPTTMPTNDQTVIADFDINSYQITFIPNLPETGVGVEEVTQTLVYRVNISTNRYGFSENNGYTFLGWYDTIDFSTPRINNVPAANTTLYAKWVPTQYRFYYYNINNSFLFYDQNAPTYQFGDDISLVSTPSTLTAPEGNRLGWFYDSQRVNEIDFNAPFIRMPLSMNEVSLLFAYPKFIPLDYSITYEVSGGLPLDGQTFAFGQSLSTLKTPTKVGYEFKGWFIDDLFQDAFTLNSMPSFDLTLYAKYEIGRFDVIFKDRLNDTLETKTFLFEEDLTSVSLPIPPVVSGYTFESWSIELPDTMPSNDLEIQAIYKANIHDLTVKLNSIGAQDIVSKRGFEETLSISDPVRIGYTFSGWFIDETLETVLNFNIMPDANLMLYAKWTINTYTITFESNEGSIVHAVTEDYNNVLSEPADPTKTGYTFSGWYRDALFTNRYVFDTVEAENITLYAKWTINTYTITFESNEGSIVHAVTEDYNNVLSEPADPTKTGYTFSGWYRDALFTNRYVFDTVEAENITLYAKWEAITYTIIFELYGGMKGLNQVENYTIESQPVLLIDATRSGYVFKGYYKEITFETLISRVETNMTNVSVHALFFTVAFNSYYEAVNQINDEISIEDKVIILSYLETYETLTTFEKSFIDVKVLEDALEIVYALEVTRVIQLIENIVTPLTLESEDALLEAKTLYDGLLESQQDNVTNDELLESYIIVLERMKDIDTLLNEEEKTLEKLQIVSNALETLTQEQLLMIDKTLYASYLELESSLQQTTPWIWIVLGSALVASAFGIFFILMKKKKNDKEEKQTS